jgi:hypothetical protein
MSTGSGGPAEHSLPHTTPHHTTPHHTTPQAALGALASLDALLSLATVACRPGYCRPVVVKESRVERAASCANRTWAGQPMGVCAVPYFCEFAS